MISELSLDSIIAELPADVRENKAICELLKTTCQEEGPKGYNANITFVYDVYNTADRAMRSCPSTDARLEEWVNRTSSDHVELFVHKLVLARKQQLEAREQQFGYGDAMYILAHVTTICAMLSNLLHNQNAAPRCY